MQEGKRPVAREPLYIVTVQQAVLVRMWRIFDHCWPDCHRPCLLLVGGQHFDLQQWPVGRE